MNKAVGFEKAFVKTWESWDGGEDYFDFINVELVDSFKERLVALGMPEVGQIDISIALVGHMTVEVSVWAVGEEEYTAPIWSQKLPIQMQLA